MKLGNWECGEGFGLGFLAWRGFGVCVTEGINSHRKMAGDPQRWEQRW